MGIPIDPSDYEPDWSPNWSDVQFDHAAASAAITALRAADAAIESAASARVRQAEHASTVPYPPGFIGPVAAVNGGILASWTGPHRTQWEGNYHTSLAQATAHRQHIVALIRAITRASEAATAEQTARERARTRWEAEAAAGRRRMEADVAKLRANGVPVSLL